MDWFGKKVVCTNCKGENVYIVEREQTKEENTIDMDSISSTTSVPLVYVMITLHCKQCGHEYNF